LWAARIRSLDFSSGASPRMVTAAPDVVDNRTSFMKGSLTAALQC